MTKWEYLSVRLVESSGFIIVSPSQRVDLAAWADEHQIAARVRQISDHVPRWMIDKVRPINRLLLVYWQLVDSLGLAGWEAVSMTGGTILFKRPLT